MRNGKNFSGRGQRNGNSCGDGNGNGRGQRNGNGQRQGNIQGRGRNIGKRSGINKNTKPCTSNNGVWFGNWNIISNVSK